MGIFPSRRGGKHAPLPAVCSRPFLRAGAGSAVSAGAAIGVMDVAARVGCNAAPLALILLYRAWVLADDTGPALALADGLAARGFRVTSIYVTSLKDIDVVASLRAFLRTQRPDIILNLTSFSARLDDGRSVLDDANVPVIQVALSGGRRDEWAASPRGLGPSDLAMNVVLPEFDGRIFAGAVSFKDEAPRSDALQFTRLVHRTEAAEPELCGRPGAGLDDPAAHAAWAAADCLRAVGLSRERRQGGLCGWARHPGQYYRDRPPPGAGGLRGCIAW